MLMLGNQKLRRIGVDVSRQMFDRPLTWPQYTVYADSKGNMAFHENMAKKTTDVLTIPAINPSAWSRILLLRLFDPGRGACLTSEKSNAQLNN